MYSIKLDQYEDYLEICYISIAFLAKQIEGVREYNIT